MKTSRLLALAALGSALASPARADLTNGIVPDFRGDERTAYAGWNDWTQLVSQDRRALPDDPATHLPSSGAFVTANLGTLTADTQNGLVCFDDQVVDSEISVAYGSSGYGYVREAFIQVSHPGGAPIGVIMEYSADVMGNPDTDFIAPVEVVALSGTETLYHFTLSQFGLPGGVFGPTYGFAVHFEFEGALSHCIDEVQLDVRHDLVSEITPACSARPNSLGVLAGMGASGSSLLSDNHFVLRSAGLPENSFGFMLTSLTASNIPCPGNCPGQLCLAGPIGRIGPAQLAGPDGQIEISLDLNAIPMNPAVAAQVGETWYFQCWYRDTNPFVTSNLSLLTGVTFR